MTLPARGCNYLHPRAECIKGIARGVDRAWPMTSPRSRPAARRKYHLRLQRKRPLCASTDDSAFDARTEKLGDDRQFDRFEGTWMVNKPSSGCVDVGLRAAAEAREKARARKNQMCPIFISPIGGLHTVTTANLPFTARHAGKRFGADTHSTPGLAIAARTHPLPESGCANSIIDKAVVRYRSDYKAPDGCNSATRE
ncbi:hypothetical protein EVAR_83336_1 [Eumeta japonica]|uniref:Uncharacterized protein n=1 Tax=Eumeta variegata TaxID=151549 RepID=A0A4C1VYA7_EUMVA|nr:hypothetical protein EVAR_83336_1 [Eumeta japonica]